ncbi:hypothetical protein [Streptomyces sp. 11x1]|uniref:hypothetical protein n=1 Tax=Streptomyces sp. 11x1 TaxID=3038642 RepID=UPI0037DA34BB
MVANVYASAGESGAGNTTRSSPQDRIDQAMAAGAATIDCPDVGSRLRQMSDQARAEVDRELALLDQQVAEACQRLQSSVRAMQQDSAFVDNAVMGPLKSKRTAAIDRIEIAIGRVADRPQRLRSLAACTLRASGNQEVTAKAAMGRRARNRTRGTGRGSPPVTADRPVMVRSPRTSWTSPPSSPTSPALSGNRTPHSANSPPTAV